MNDHLLARGCRADTEYIVIGESPVSRLKLTAQQRGLCEPSTWVAMALQTGRAKDHVCILQLLEKDAVDPSKLEKLLKEFNPADKWAQFESKYLERRK